MKLCFRVVRAFAVMFLGVCGSVFADVPRKDLGAPDIKSFLSFAPAESKESRLAREPWFVSGVTNHLRSAEFMQRLRDEMQKGNSLAQGYLGTLLISAEGSTNYNEGLQLLQGSATNGCLPAMNELGYVYRYGKYGVPRDEAQALNWIREAADKGFSDAQQQLADCYERGTGVARDYGESFKWYQRAAEQKHPVGIGSLGVCYLEGRGVAKDYGRAEKYFKEAIELGNVRAKLNLGILYTETNYQTNEFQHGIELIREAARADDFRAQLALANLNIWGKGMPMNVTNFVTLARLSADVGFDEAQLSLGRFLLSDQFGMQDFVQARELLTRAAQQNQAEACYLLAYMCDAGQGAPASLADAISWYRKAAELGHRDSQFRYATAFFRGIGVETNKTEGLIWLKRSAENGWPKAEQTLGAFYSSGTGGLKQDLEEALRWMLRAANHGDVLAQYEIASAYLYGKYGVGKSIPNALEWFQKAADQGHPQSQTSVGYGWEIGATGPVDLIEAYKWYQLALQRDDATAKKNLERLEPKLTPEQIAEGKKRMAAFKPRYSNPNPMADVPGK